MSAPCIWNDHLEASQHHICSRSSLCYRPHEEIIFWDSVAKSEKYIKKKNERERKHMTQSPVYTAYTWFDKVIRKESSSFSAHSLTRIRKSFSFFCRSEECSYDKVDADDFSMTITIVGDHFLLKYQRSTSELRKSSSDFFRNSKALKTNFRQCMV